MATWCTMAPLRVPTCLAQIFEELSMEEEHGEVRVGIKLELQKGVLRPHGHGGPGHRLPNHKQRATIVVCQTCHAFLASGCGGSPMS